MKREEKAIIVDELKDLLGKYTHLYFTDISDLNAKQTSQLRRTCFEQNIRLVVAKNTLLKLALDQSGKNTAELHSTLVGSTSMMLSNVGNAPAKLITEFRKSNAKPILKSAFVEESIYIGDNQLETLVSIKSKEELIGDIIMILQSPMKNVISSLQSGKHTLAGLVKTLSERE